jgi:predicted adenylyl cyclase CyaB
MPRNVEIKARITDPSALARMAEAIADRAPQVIAQDDTFFNCTTGRLKLRVFSPMAGELIFYRRPDQTGPKESFYVIAPTSAPEAMRAALTLAYGQFGRVRKRRTVYRVGRTRIHLDEVESLGHFLELEVVLEDNETTAAGVAVAHALMHRLEVEPQRLIEGAYVDLLARAHGHV